MSQPRTIDAIRNSIIPCLEKPNPVAFCLYTWKATNTKEQTISIRQQSPIATEIVFAYDTVPP